EVGQALGNERARHDAAGLERNPLAPSHDQTTGLARAEPCRTRRAQERGGLHHRLRQLGDVSAEVGEPRLDVDRARSRQRRGGADYAVAGEIGVGEDPDVAPWTAEGIGTDLTAVEDDEVDRVSLGANRDVAPSPESAMDARGDLAIEQVHLRFSGRDGNIPTGSLL